MTKSERQHSAAISAEVNSARILRALGGPWPSEQLGKFDPARCLEHDDDDGPSDEEEAEFAALESEELMGIRGTPPGQPPAGE